MALSIKSREAEGLARQLAAATGETLTRALTIALRERLDRLEGHQARDVEERAARLQKIAKDAATRWAEPYRTADHGTLLYDDRGLPR